MPRPLVVAVLNLTTAEGTALTWGNEAIVLEDGAIVLDPRLRGATLPERRLPEGWRAAIRVTHDAGPDRKTYDVVLPPLGEARVGDDAAFRWLARDDFFMLDVQWPFGCAATSGGRSLQTPFSVAVGPERLSLVIEEGPSCPGATVEAASLGAYWARAGPE